MSARIFISYRSSDGADKATALARDLGRVFGDAAVFLDKDDLPGGSAWAQEIGRAIGRRPVLLLLLTPDLLGARGDDGRPRIEAADDPVRRELEAAFAAGAQVIPVLCDGLAAAPAALPPPFDRLGALTWRHLRAYDWRHDVERLVTDLRALGAGPAVAPDAAPARRRPGLAIGASLLAAAALAAGLAWWSVGRTPADPAARIAGRWSATLGSAAPVQVVIEATPQGLSLASAPIPIASRADWSDYRRFWRERFGTELDAVTIRGSGALRSGPGEPPAIDLAIRVHPVPAGTEPIDGGNLGATLAPDGRRLAGTLWLNSTQAGQPAVLERE